jgi:hypothetical protein
VFPALVANGPFQARLNYSNGFRSGGELSVCVRHHLDAVKARLTLHFFRVRRGDKVKLGQPLGDKRDKIAKLLAEQKAKEMAGQ